MFGWSYQDIISTPYFVIQGMLQILNEETQEDKKVAINQPEWDEWKQYGDEWVRAQWQQAKTP